MTEHESDSIGGPCDSCASVAPALVMVEAHLHPDDEETHLCRTCYDELAAESPLLPVLDDIVEAAEEVETGDEWMGRQANQGESDAGGAEREDGGEASEGDEADERK